MDYKKQQAVAAKRRAEIERKHASGMSYTRLALLYGVSPARIGQIVREVRDGRSKAR